MTPPSPNAIETSNEAHPLARRYVAWLLRHGRWLWLVAVALTIPASLRTIDLYAHLKSDIEELLPRRAPSVTALEELRGRMPGLRYLGIVVDTGTAEQLPAAEHFLDDLAARIERYPTSLVAAVRTGIGPERRFFEAHAPLYVELADLEAIRDRIETSRDAAVTHELGLDLDDEVAEAESPTLDFHELEGKIRAQEKDAQRFPRDRFSSAEKGLSLLLVQAAEFTTGAGLGRDLMRRIERDIADLGGLQHYAPGMRIGYTGDIAINVEELTALEQDLAVASAVVLVLVLAVVVAFYRWWGSAWALLLPLTVAAIDTFALVTLPPMRVTSLNSNTAFLGSVIVGNGVNSGIILLARYVEERRRGRAIQDALTLAVAGSRRGTLAAALAASASYGALVLTEFRGFNQFGIIGGLGMLLSWAAAFVLGPPLIAWLDRNGASVPARAQPQRTWMNHVANVVTHHPVPILVVASVITVAAALKLKGLGRDWIQYDFSQLRRADTHQVGEAYWGRRMDDLIGRYLTPLVVLTDNPEEARSMARRLRRATTAPPLSDVVASVRAADDLIPAGQERKIAVLGDIRRDLTPRMRARLTPEQRRLVDRYLDSASLEPVRPADLPEAVTAGLRERDGAIDRAVLVYPRPSRAMWQGPSIVSLTAALRGVVETREGPGRAGRLAGSLPLSADIITSIERDGPRATAVAFGAVVAIVVVIFRLTATTPLILGSLLLAVTWLVGAMMALGIKVNFCNFVAFPITFGIGVDYAVNIMTRVREGRGQSIAEAIRTTGGAVGLSSMTTIIGYGSLLFAQNRALFSFGVVAVLGEIACLTTAIIVLPAILVGRREPRAMTGSLPDPRT
ncbi:MAG TPA: MMPL family transporter [Polyangiaceae bacterium]|nr:MMPL family transporter [Polyangiaceae bacterium]